MEFLVLVNSISKTSFKTGFENGISGTKTSFGYRLSGKSGSGKSGFGNGISGILVPEILAKPVCL